VRSTATNKCQAEFNLFNSNVHNEASLLDVDSASLSLLDVNYAPLSLLDVDYAPLSVSFHVLLVCISMWMTTWVRAKHAASGCMLVLMAHANANASVGSVHGPRQ